MNRLQSQVQSHLSAIRQNTEKLLTKDHSKTNNLIHGIRKEVHPENVSNTREFVDNLSFAKEPHANANGFRRISETRRSRRSGLSASSPLLLDFAHRLFTPEHYEDRYEYPLVIWLHSQDSSEYELDGVMPHLSLRNYVAIAPRAIQTSKLNERKFCWNQSPTNLAIAEKRVMQSISHAITDLSIRPDRVFLAGYGTGGTLAQWIGLRNSESIAGVVSINGTFPERCKSILQWRDARKMPVMFIHGSDSTLCNADQTCHALKSAHSAGLSFQFIQFPCGDELNTAMTATANQFIMNIVTG